MSEIPLESAPGTWTVPSCPFTIEYVPRVLDDIRLAIVDAFFSLPRGGAEIGGILLGRHTEARVTIAEHLPFECEHALGPSFVLSANDETKLREMLESASQNLAGLKPVGWYHSHTRSEIFLSGADKGIHDRFFPEPWQVALVLKPHTFQPARCGFFFREADGGMHTTECYQEFELDAMPLRPMPGDRIPSAIPELPIEFPRQTIDAMPEAPRFDPPPPPAIESVLRPEPEPVAVNPEPPLFGSIGEPERMWPGLRMIAALAAGFALCAGAFATRQAWAPKVMNIGKPAAKTVVVKAPQPVTPAPVPAPAAGSGAGKNEQVAQLKSDLAAETEQVKKVQGLLADQSLMVSRAAKTKAELDAANERIQKLEDSLKDAEAKAAEAARLRKDLAAANDRNKKLTKSLADAQDGLREQQRKRLGAQDPGTAKQR